MHPLTALICGNCDTSGSIEEVRDHLADTLDRLFVRAVKLKKDADKIDMALFGPLIGRAIMETAFTAITARFDPFRILAIRNSQLSPDYDMASRNSLAFNWSFDVKGDSKIKPLEEAGTKDISRALLGDHCGELFWLESFQIFLDNYDNGKSIWLQELVKITPDSFIKRIGSLADRTYSELSKSIHFEFVIPLTKKLDYATVSDLLDTSCKVVGWLGLVASYSPIVHPLKGIPINLLEEAYEELKI